MLIHYNLQYNDDYIGCLHEHLRHLNFCAPNGGHRADLQEFILIDEFRADWIQLLQKITSTIENRSRQIVQTTDECFGSITRALSVLIYSYVEDSIRGKHPFDGEAIKKFLDVTEKCIKQRRKFSSCFQLLKICLQLPKPDRKANILKELK